MKCMCHLDQKTKRNYYESPEMNDINCNKKFWTTVKLPFVRKYNQLKMLRWMRMVN